MPICMDRHEMEGATARALADAHQKDLKLQAKFGVKLKGFSQPLRLFEVQWQEV